jgi:hypothetical protein
MKIFFVASASVGHMRRAREVMKRYPGEVNYLMSFAYWKSTQAIKYWAWLRANGDECIVDSGAFTYLNAQGGLELPYATIEDYCDAYFRYLDRLSPLWDRFVDLDLYKLYGNQKIIEDVWPLMFQYQQKSGRPCIFVWHRELGQKGWDIMLNHPDIHWMGFNRDIPYSDPPLWRRLVDQVHSHGKRCHGFAAVRRPLMEASNLDTADSTTAFTTTDKFGQSEFYDSRVGGHGYMITKNSLRSLKRTLEKAGSNTDAAKARHLRELRHHISHDVGAKITGRRADKDALCVENICHLVEMQREITNIWNRRLANAAHRVNIDGEAISKQLESEQDERTGL